MRRLKILNWNVHGNYLHNLSLCPHDFYVSVPDGPRAGYVGANDNVSWPDNLQEVPERQVKALPLDCILFQSKANYLEDQYNILTPEQQLLPRIFLEHDPPGEHPTDSVHVVHDPAVLLVHVTHFNELMWNSNGTPTRVIEHGVSVPDRAEYSGEVAAGIAVVNDLAHRGRPLGLDILQEVREQIPIDLVGIGSEQVGGRGELPRGELNLLEANYRFFFNPIRYSSLGLAVCEAMMIGLPIVGLATTEMATAIENGVSGFVGTDVRWLVDRMKELLDDLPLARELGANARATACERFNLDRFVADWDSAFALVAQ